MNFQNSLQNGGHSADMVSAGYKIAESPAAMTLTVR